MPRGGSSVPGSEWLSSPGSFSLASPGSHQGEACLAFPFPLGYEARTAVGGGRQRERSPAHRGTVLFSGRLWDRKLGGLFRVPNYALHKTTMQRQAAERTRSDKKLRRPWQGLLVCPPTPRSRCSAWTPPEEHWQILEMMVSRGDRTPPITSLPEDTSLQPSP